MNAKIGSGDGSHDPVANITDLNQVFLVCFYRSHPPSIFSNPVTVVFSCMFTPASRSALLNVAINRLGANARRWIQHAASHIYFHFGFHP